MSVEGDGVCPEPESTPDNQGGTQPFQDENWPGWTGTVAVNAGWP